MFQPLRSLLIKFGHTCWGTKIIISIWKCLLKLKMGCLARSRIWKSHKWERSRSKTKNVEYRRLKEWLNNKVKEPNKRKQNNKSYSPQFLINIIIIHNETHESTKKMGESPAGIQISLTQISLFLSDRKKKTTTTTTLL